MHDVSFGKETCGYPESYPTFELEPRDSEVLLTFKHFPVLALPGAGALRCTERDGLAHHAEHPDRHANGEAVEDRAEYFAKNAALYGVDMNNLAR